MTEREFNDAYYRLIVEYGMPHQVGKDNTAHANDWRIRFNRLDADRFNEAITRVIDGRLFNSFPKAGEVKLQYDALLPAPSTETLVDDEGLSPRDRRLFAQYRAIDEAIHQESAAEKRALSDKVDAILSAHYQGKMTSLISDSEHVGMEHVGVHILANVVPEIFGMMLAREIYAREHNLPLDFKSGLLDPPVTSRNIKNGAPARRPTGELPETINHGAVMVAESGSRGSSPRGGSLTQSDERRGVMPVEKTSDIDYPIRPVTVGGGRVYERPAQRFQPPEDPWESEEIPF